MAIQGRDDDNAGAGTKGGAAPSGPSAGYTAKKASGRSGLGGALGNFDRPFSRNLGEIVGAFCNAANEMITNSSHGETNWKVLPLDAGRLGLYYSAAVLVGTYDIGGSKFASAHTLILEASNKAPAAEIIQFAGRNVEILRTAMDAWDETTWDDVQKIVAQAYPNVKIINAGANVVPASAEFRQDDVMYSILSEASNAAASVIESMFPNEFPAINLASDFDRNSERLISQFSYNGPDLVTGTGLPMRSDYSATLRIMDRAGVSRQSDISSFQHQQSKDIVDTHAYCDLVYVTPTVPQPGQSPDMRHYYPRIILTKIDAMRAPLNMETYLLGLATMRLLGKDYAWASVFNNFGDQMHDIGAIGYRMRNPADPTAPGVRFETKSNAFGQDELSDLIMRSCFPDALFSIDCEDVGSDSWLTSLFVNAAKGDQQSAQFIVQSANTLTGGHFGKYFNGNEPIVYDEGNRVHLGTFVDQGHSRDIREIDYLAALNTMGHNNLDKVLEWEATFNDTNVPIEQRLDRRRNLMTEMVPSTIKFRGFAERVTLSDSFLTALINSLASAGLSMEIENLQPIYGHAATPGNQLAAQYAARGGNINGLMAPVAGGPGFPGINRGRNRWF